MIRQSTQDLEAASCATPRWDYFCCYVVHDSDSPESARRNVRRLGSRSNDMGNLP